MKFPVRKVLGKTPLNPLDSKPIPEGAVILNAPRPLCGTMFNGYILFTSNRSQILLWFHYPDFHPNIWGFTSIVSADDPYRENWLKENKSLDATVIQFVDEVTARQQLIAYLLTEYSQEHLDTVIGTEYFEEDWHQYWYNEFGESEIEV